MIEEKQKSLKEMLEEEAKSPGDENVQQSVKSVQEQLKRLIQDLRHMPEGQYHEVITSEFELTLEYHYETVLIWLYTVKGKNFRRFCDEGQNRVQISLTPQQIYDTVKDRSQACYVDGSQLVLGEFGRIELKQVQLGETTKLRIEFSRFVRKFLKQIKKKDPIEKLKNELEQTEKYAESLIMQTPHVGQFFIQANNITCNTSCDGFGYYQVLLGEVLARTTPFVLYARINNTLRGGIHIGVTDQLTQKQAQWSYKSGNAVSYGGYGYINYGSNGKWKCTKTGVKLKKGAELRMQIELDNGVAIFSIAGTNFTQHCDILCQKNRQFVPCFQLCEKGDSIQWRIG